ncbi:MAG: translation initiation factor IF-2 N-terminal domain-containing protein, partial [Flavobacteriales bacterium]|nr:translation initiation factor IF-2 N-terminal domain-containing protein [Flavobacteriales bacterium]
MPEATKRLSKVAREFNVSIPTIIDFLSEKGIDIEAKPNTKIDPDVYTVLVDEFQDEKIVKEESRLVGLNKVKRETITLDDKEKKASQPN